MSAANSFRNAMQAAVRERHGATHTITERWAAGTLSRTSGTRRMGTGNPGDGSMGYCRTVPTGRRPRRFGHGPCNARPRLSVIRSSSIRNNRAAKA